MSGPSPLILSPLAEEPVLAADFEPPLRCSRSVFITFILLLVLAFPLKLIGTGWPSAFGDLRGRVLGASETALSDLGSAISMAQEGDYPAAREKFTAAASTFGAARSELDFMSGWLNGLAKVVPNREVKQAAAARHILAAGQQAAELGAVISRVAGARENNSADAWETVLRELLAAREEFISRLGALTSEITAVDTGCLPAEYQDQFAALKEKAIWLNQGFAELTGLIDNLAWLAGLDTDRRYLFVFQNNAEMRASGGFIGSYALGDISRGRIKKFEAPAGGSYDTTAGLNRQIAAPEPLRLVSPRWYFWDANWWPDWPTSARKLAWFLEKSNGPTVDGVIALTPTAVEKMLRVFGPLDLSAEFGLVVTADNFWTVVEREAEKKPPETNEPKKIIGAMIERLLAELPDRIKGKDWLRILEALAGSFYEKHILVYFFNEPAQNMAIDYGWDGGIRETNGDYLSVIHTNIAGGKSDRVMREEIAHEAVIAADGSVVDEITITRTHAGLNRQEFVGVRHNDWLRVYVPDGSELIAAEGFSPPPDGIEPADPAWEWDELVKQSETGGRTHAETGTRVYEEFGKTVFANWVVVDPASTSVVKLKYRLPPLWQNPLAGENGEVTAEAPSGRDLSPYSLLFQKQPGAPSVSFHSRAINQKGGELIWRYPAGLNANSAGWQVNAEVKTDKLWAMLYTK